MRGPPLLPLVGRALPLTLLLGVGLGAVVVAGAHYSNAWPSDEAPFGWPGVADFERGVAMVRNELILATSVPALVLGAHAFAGREPHRDGAGALLRIYGVRAALIVLAVMLAATIGSLGAAKTPFDAWFAFVVAHSVLGLSFLSLGSLWACLLREHALAAAGATWLVFVGLFEAVTRTILFRTEGFHQLAAGGFPGWFWGAQAASPLSSYTGILILWRPYFRDHTETAALKDAVLPAWLAPATFVALALVLWILVPLLLGLAGWRARARWHLARPRRATSST